MLIKSFILISMISMLWWRSHIIMMLISLEFLLLSSLMGFSSLSISSSSFSILIFLAMMVSGSALGLSLLVALTRTHFSSSSLFINYITFDKNCYSSIYSMLSKN